MPQLTFLLDVDNTLIDNDAVKKDLDQRLHAALGEKITSRFWQIYEQVRLEQGVVDIPLSLARLRAETPLERLDEQTYQRVHTLFDTYPFFQYLYPHALETLHYLRTLGPTVIVSDGDQYFQAEKIKNSHLAEAVEGRILIYVHKQAHLDEIRERYPADHYVMIDDKPQILADSAALLNNQLTPVFVRQGKYAHQAPPLNFHPTISVEHIGDLRTITREQFLQA